MHAVGLHCVDSWDAIGGRQACSSGLRVTPSSPPSASPHQPLWLALGPLGVLLQVMYDWVQENQIVQRLLRTGLHHKQYMAEVGGCAFA